MQSSRLAVDGAEIFYDVAGQGDLIVLVHGSAADASTWYPLMNDLATSNRVVAYDRRGYGRSKHAPVRDHRVHTRDLDALLTHLGAPAHVVGWSSGGIIGLDLAIQREQNVASLALVEAPLHGLRHATAAMFGALLEAKFAQLCGRHEQGARSFLRWASGTRDGGNGFDRASDDAQRRLLGHSRVLLAELDPHFYGSLGEFISFRDVARIAVPITWLVGGASSPWYAGLAARAKKAAPAIRLEEIEGASHLMHAEKPEAFAAAVRRAMQLRPDAKPVEHAGQAPGT
jgi:pimeloyl-ACP methyl ester carboxylesterase